MRRAESISDFLGLTAKLREIFGFKRDDRFGPWFRGQERAQWSLCPKLYRDYGGYKRVKDEIEDEIREEFIVRAPILCESLPAGDDGRTEWEWYFLMQHHGVPTRLLDWTEGALIGLFFAVRNNPGHYDATVWVLDPYELNKQVIGIAETIAPNASGVSPRDRIRVKRWLSPRFKDTGDLPKEPVAVYPTHVVRRISTQRSCFTVHGSDEKALDNREKKKNSCLAKIVIPSFSVSRIRAELESCGIDENTIFPDLDGLGRSICTNWLPDYQEPPHQGVYTRLRPSKVAKGQIGVFAITPIKKGTPLFYRDNEEMLWQVQSSLPKRPSEIRKLYDDFAVFKDGRCGCPPNLNRLTMSWYLNEPKRGEKPNVGCNPETYDFFAMQDIKPGDELTVKYNTYSDVPGTNPESFRGCRAVAKRRRAIRQ